MNKDNANIGLTNPGIIVKKISAVYPSLAGLLAQSDAHFAALYPPASNHLANITALSQPNVTIYGIELMGELGGELVACGAVKIMNNDGIYGEIKRLFVLAPWRQFGYAGLIMDKLHAHLREANIPLARLETGRDEPAPIKFYQKLGYRQRPPFGDYRADPLSIFMEKLLTA